MIDSACDADTDVSSTTSLLNVASDASEASRSSLCTRNKHQRDATNATQLKLANEKLNHHTIINPCCHSNVCINLWKQQLTPR